MIYEAPTEIGRGGIKPTEVDGRLRDPRTVLAMRLLWFAIALLCITAFAVAIPYLRNRLLTDAQSYAAALASLGLSQEFYATYLTIRELLIVAPGLLLGTFLFMRRSDNRMVLLLSIAMVTLATSSGEAIPSLPNAWQWAAYFINVFSLMITLVVIMVLPDGKFHPRWCFVVVAAYLVWELIYFYPLIDLVNKAENFSILRLVRLIFFGVAIGIQIYRYRVYYVPMQRQQTKWVIFGLAVVLFGNVLVLLIRTLWPVVPADNPSVWFLQVFILIPLLRIVPFLLTYVSLVFAVNRYRLWEVDLFINRGLVVAGLTLLLGIVFFLVVYLLQGILQTVTGSTQSNIAIIMSTLAIGALFQPVRKQLQFFVDRRLYGIKVNFRAPRLERPAPPPLSESAITGKHFGEYQVIGMLGRGGMGDVYRARQSNLNREVAVKVLPAVKAINEEYRARFEREAKTVATLHHPNIVQVFDFGEQNGDTYMVMEYVEGEGLDAYIRQHAPLSLEVVQSIMEDVCAALDYAHDQGLVHRDVKPSNVMLRPVTTQSPRPFGYRAILMDFGVARIVTDVSTLTQSGVIVGTFDYMSPEQISGARTVDHRADIYSLGVMLFQMLTGKLPFAGDNPGVIVFSHMQRPAPDPREFQPTIPAHVAFAVVRALSKVPDFRFERAGELALALHAEYEML
ncbi:MAG: protein kinase [Anaerolineae bacterium]|nr:protein kinase [Anaerolineae bacterium]